jgi:hypothetical protein
MKLFTFLSVAFISLSSMASAMTLSISRGGAGNGIIAQNDGGALLSTGGYYIGAGTFASVPSITSAATLKTAVDNFLEFGSALSPTTGGTIGTISATISGNGTNGGNTALDFNGKTIYFLIGNAATKAASTQFSIFTLNTGATPTITFDPNVAGSATNNITLSTVGSINVLSGAGSVVDNANPTQDRLVLAPIPVVPEPSVLSLLAVLGAMSFRRRR